MSRLANGAEALSARSVERAETGVHKLIGGSGVYISANGALISVMKSSPGSKTDNDLASAFAQASGNPHLP